jgi:hypothetical protein
LSALIDAKGTARESTFDPVPTREVPGYCTAEPVLEAATWTALSFCRACGSAEREHGGGGEHNLLHGYDL